MFKYCVVIPSNINSGPNNVALEIINGLINRSSDIRVTVYYFKHSVENVIIFDESIEVKKISFFEKVNLNDYDLVHCHMLKPDLFVVFRKFFFKKRGYKTLTTIHQKDIDNLKYDYNSIFKAVMISYIWRIAIRCHDHIVMLSKSMKDYYGNIAKDAKISIIHNGRFYLRVIDIRKDYEKENKHIILGTVCRITARKGLEQVVKVIKDMPGYVYYIYGDGPEKENIEKVIRAFGVDDKVKFVGKGNDVDSFLRNIDIFVLPSRAEGFPLALIEAASIGLPCVVSRIDVCKEMFDKSEVSFFELDDICSLREAINYAYLNREYYSSKIYDKYKKEMTLDVMVNKYASVFESLLSKSICI